MEERRKKIIKVLGGAGLSTNVRAVVRILGALQECPEEDLREVLDANKSDLYGSVVDLSADLMWTMSLPRDGGGTFDFPAVSFSKMLQRACQTSPVLRSKLWEIWQRDPSTPSTPLSICIYGDEIVPGNVLRLDHSRKTFLLFASIKDLGPTVLKSIDAWFPMLAVRSNELKDVDGGISRCVRLLLRRMFVTEKINTHGVVVCLDERQTTPVALHFRLSNLIFDGDALRQVFSSKGAKGKLPCVCCVNVVHEDEAVPSPEFVSLTNTDASKLQFATSEDLYEKADALSRSAPPAMGKVKFRRLEMASGLNYAPEGLLWDRELRGHVRLAETVTFDSMHILLANGMACDEVSLLFGTIMDKGAMGKHVVTWDHLRTFVNADFRFCSQFRQVTKPSLILGKPREDRYKRDGVINFGASEMLQICPLLLYFLEVVLGPTGLAPLAIASFRALGCVIGMTQWGKRGRSDADELARAIRLHGIAFQAAYGCSSKTKPHWLLHVPHQLSRDGWILDAFVGERANNVAKKAATEVDNLRVFERSVLSRHTLDFLHRIADPHLFENRLLQPELCCGLLSTGGDAWASTACVWEGLRLIRGDVVLLKEPKHWSARLEGSRPYGPIGYGARWGGPRGGPRG